MDTAITKAERLSVASGHAGGLPWWETVGGWVCAMIAALFPFGWEESGAFIAAMGLAAFGGAVLGHGAKYLHAYFVYAPRAILAKRNAQLADRNAELESQLRARDRTIAEAARAKPKLQMKKHQDGYGRCYAVVMNDGGKAECIAQVLRSPSEPDPLKSGMWKDLPWGENAEKGLRVTIPADGSEYVLLGKVDSDPVVSGRTFELSPGLVPAGLTPSSTGWEEDERRVGVLYYLRVFSEPPGDRIAVATFEIRDDGFDIVLTPSEPHK